MFATASGYLLFHRNPDTDRVQQMENVVSQSTVNLPKEVGGLDRGHYAPTAL